MFFLRASSWSRIPEEVVYIAHQYGCIVGFKESSYQDDDTEASGREQQVDPRLDLSGLDVEARGDDTSLVEPAV